MEGPTEEEFVNASLAIHLLSRGIYVTPILIGRARQRVQGGGSVTIHERFVFPYVQMHEFEGLLFSDVGTFERVIPGAPIDDLRSIRAAFDRPEDINDDPNTVPSKRIRQLIPMYRKRLHGPGVAGEIGLDAIRSECPRFDGWLHRLEALGEDTSS